MTDTSYIEIDDSERPEWEKFYEEIRATDEKAIPIPYAFVAGAVNVTGIFYLKENVEDSYTDGIFVGIINGDYHLDKNHQETCPSAGVLKLCLRLNLSDKKLEWRICNKDWRFRWKCHGWNKIISF